MAAILKRKGGPIEINNNTPKRVKSAAKVIDRPVAESPASTRKTAQIRQTFGSTTTDLSKNGWDAAFRVLGSEGSEGELIRYHGIEEKARPGDSIVDTTLNNSISSYSTAIPNATPNNKDSKATWKMIDSVGGRTLNVDPIFVGQEKYFVIAQKRSVLVYSAINSLLNRSITLVLPENAAASSRIVAMSLSEMNANQIWVAYSTGFIYCVDWTTGSGSHDYWSISSQTVTYLTTSTLEYAESTHNIIYTTDKAETGNWRIQAHEMIADGNSVARTIYTSNEEIQSVKAATDGSVIIASSGSRLLIGHLRSRDFSTLERVKYLFRVFESSDDIYSMDLRVTSREIVKGTKQKQQTIPVIDVAVGDVKGSIFVHNDLLNNLILAEASDVEGQGSINLMPRRLHWHQKCVDAVKWSRDGNYIISGGSENVMVQWQLDTGKHGFLPNLTARIRNIVVSPIGSSYAVNLADNSTLVLSTAELEPTAHISGLQAHVIKPRDGLDARIHRLREDQIRKPLIPRVPALINPFNPSHLLLAVGDTQEIDAQHATKNSVPYLQTFDISSSHTITRQPLTRTNIITARQFAPSALRIHEPRVTHMQVSHNGKWLATIDEWLPPRRDLNFLRYGGSESLHEQNRRREVFLKFWKWNDEAQNWELVSRVDAPHTISSVSTGAGQVLALVADPGSLSFSTIGEDGIVRVWKPRTRKRDNIVVKAKDGEVLVDWKCQHSISLEKPDLADVTVDDSLYERPEHGCLSYSEDGSLLAAGLSTSDDGLIYLLDPSNGIVRSSRPGLYTGSLIALAILSRNLIILANSLEVHDLVAETLLYQIALGKQRMQMSIEQKAHMMHLAVDPLSSTFAVALPTTATSSLYSSEQRNARKSLDNASTQVVVFTANSGIPLVSHTLDTFATALVAAVGNPGYILLDASAEVTPIIPRSVQSITSTAQPIANQQLGLGDENDVAERGLADLLEDAEDTDNNVKDENTLDNDIDIDMDDEYVEDDGPRVVSQQALNNIFDKGPSFTMPPIEEMFHQVCELFSSKAMDL